MPAHDHYRHQVTLLIQILPFIEEETCFALKGGTAINLFVRDMPRLSVDIDLTYLPVADRKTSLQDINTAMRRLAENIRAEIPGIQVHETSLQDENAVYKLVINLNGAQVKVEVTPVLRGCVYDPETRTVSSRVEAEYGFVEANLVSFADLYAGKIVAALDRQHPRDLFDIRELFAQEGIDDALREAFVIYLLSHNRPITEVLAPNYKDIRQVFEREFSGMTEETVTIHSLLDTREQLVDIMATNMPKPHRELLLSFEQGEPDWSLITVKGVEDLPAVKWRMLNNQSLTPTKRQQLVQSLREVLI